MADLGSICYALAGLPESVLVSCRRDFARVRSILGYTGFENAKTYSGAISRLSKHAARMGIDGAGRGKRNASDQSAPLPMTVVCMIGETQGYV